MPSTKSSHYVCSSCRGGMLVQACTFGVIASPTWPHVHFGVRRFKSFSAFFWAVFLLCLRAASSCSRAPLPGDELLLARQTQQLYQGLSHTSFIVKCTIFMHALTLIFTDQDLCCPPCDGSKNECCKSWSYSNVTSI